VIVALCAGGPCHDALSPTERDRSTSDRVARI
jgi:hypothetical protein